MEEIVPFSNGQDLALIKVKYEKIIDINRFTPICLPESGKIIIGFIFLKSSYTNV